MFRMTHDEGRASVQVYEVFRQEEEGEALKHTGSVAAPHLELALLYAREVYSRRGEALRLWVVPRTCIAEIAEGDFLRPPLERTYRMGEGYRVTVQKRRALQGGDGA